MGQQWVVQEKRDGIELYSEFRIDPQIVVGQLDGVKEELHRCLNLAPEHSKTIEVILFQSAASYRSYLSSRVPAALSRRAIFYKSGDLLQVYAYRHDQLLTDLRHEYTHAVLHQTLPFIPLWIDEGLAEYLEEQSEKRTKSSRFAAVKWKSRTGWSPDLKRLEGMRSATGMTSDEYRDSWAWICFLLNDSDQSRLLLSQYLAAIAAGEAPGTFSEWTAVQQPGSLKHIGSYFRRLKIPVP